MDRTQAMTLLKRMVISRLVSPDWISIEKAKDETCKLKVKVPSKTHELEEFVSCNWLNVEEQGDYWLISQA